MAYHENLANRVRAALKVTPDVTEKKMFGGLAFLSRGHMFIGINDDSLMVRVGKPNYEAALDHQHVRVMDFTGKPLAGYVYVDMEGLRTPAQFKYWIDLSLGFVGTLPSKSSS